MKDKKIRYEFRKQRTRRNVLAAAHGLPRLSVHRSLKYVYAQVVDDSSGKTLVSATSFKKGSTKCAKSVDAAKAVGKEIAEKAKKAGIEKVVFDRGAYLYHGRVKALAESARSAGLKF
jgi:large subunit ribosomal protein L18